MVTSKAQPSAVDAGALDDLDLDDMFADDGDMLFEGLDIQLEGMGDIITTEKKEPPKSSSSGRGPRAKRAAQQSVEEEEEGSEATPKRRKTKRRTKTPVAFGDEDNDYVEEKPKKKSRKSGPVGKKGAAAAASPPAPTATFKKKKVKKGESSVGTSAKSKKMASTSMIPPPTAVGGIARGTSANVAAAGRFGKRGSGGKVKRGSTKLKGAVADSTGTGAATVAPPVPTMFVPKKESTYGGLHPSKTHFYPFLEGVPSEPSMKRKQFVNLDRISSALNSFLNQASGGAGGEGDKQPPSTAAATAAELSMESPIVQLLLESFEGISEKDKQAFGDAKKQALLASIPELRSTIQGMDTSKLLADLYGSCGLLTRQYNFLKTCLTNMNTWCKANFSDADYRQAFSLPEPFRPEKVGTVISSTNRKWKKSIIPINIVFAGHKEAKGTPLLMAKIPQVLVMPGEKKKKEKEEASKKKKKKAMEKPAASASSTTKTASAPPLVPKIPAATKAYSDCLPPERRQRILEKVAQLALSLEGQMNRRRTKRSTSSLPSSVATSTAKATPAPDKAAITTASYIPEEEPALHTARMWEWLEAAGFFQSAHGSSDSSSSKLPLQSPEIFPRGLLLPTPTRIQGRNEPSQETVGEANEDAKIRHERGTSKQISSNGLYDRLQSLLVVEDDIDDEENRKQSRFDESSDTEGDSDDESLSFLDDETDDEYYDLQKPKETLADLSKLSMEERTFLQLCSVGLIKKSLFPTVELVLEEYHGRKDDAIEDDLINVIGEMSTDLSTLTARNNARIGYLESAMDPMDAADRKQLDEEQASIVAKCQSLLKRSKEKAKKSNKQKTSGSSIKDDLNLPW